MLTGILFAIMCFGTPDSTKVTQKQRIEVYQQKKFEDTAKQFERLEKLVKKVEQKRQKEKTDSLKRLNVQK